MIFGFRKLVPRSQSIDYSWMLEVVLQANLIIVLNKFRNYFIKDHRWLQLSLILFLCFILIPQDFQFFDHSIEKLYYYLKQFGYYQRFQDSNVEIEVKLYYLGKQLLRSGHLNYHPSQINFYFKSKQRKSMDRHIYVVQTVIFKLF